MVEFFILLLKQAFFHYLFSYVNSKTLFCPKLSTFLFPKEYMVKSVGRHVPSVSCHTREFEEVNTPTCNLKQQLFFKFY